MAMGLMALGPGIAVGQAVAAPVIWLQAGTALKGLDATGAVVRDSGNVLPGGNWGIAQDGLLGVWVSNWSGGQNTVSRFDVSGSPAGTYVAGGAVTAGASSVGPIAIDALNYVYVGDPRDGVAGSVTKLDPTGAFVATWPVYGNSVRWMQIDQAGDLWVIVYYTASGTGHLQHYSPTGVFVAAFAPSASPNALYADEWGRIVISHWPSGQYTTAFTTTGTQIFQDPCTYSGTIGVAPDGRVWHYNSIYNPANAGCSFIPGTVVFYTTSISFDATGQTWMFGQNGLGGVSAQRISSAGGVLGSTNLGPSSPNGASYNFGDPTGLIRARTVDPTGDMDYDGFGNMLEVTAGSSPIDPVSIPASIFNLNQAYVGGTFSVAISAPQDAGRPYFAPFSLNSMPFPLSVLSASDLRSFPISPLDAWNPVLLDPVWILSTSGTFPGNAVFPGTFGTLNATGIATVNVLIPNVPSIIGLQIHTAFCTLSASSPSGVKAVSNRLTAQVY